MVASETGDAQQCAAVPMSDSHVLRPCEMDSACGWVDRQMVSNSPNMAGVWGCGVILLPLLISLALGRLKAHTITGLSP